VGATELKSGKYKKQSNFINDYLGGEKTEKMKNLLFVGGRNEGPESPVYKGRGNCGFCALFLKPLYIKECFKRIFSIFLT